MAALQRAGKPVQMITLPGEDHWLSTGETRLTMLKAAVAFVEKYNPADAGVVGPVVQAQVVAHWGAETRRDSEISKLSP